MKTELENQLIEKYPKIFQVSEDRKMEPFAMFGVETGDGWYDLLNHLAEYVHLLI